MIETWKDIEGYNGRYQVDREGRVRRVYASGKTRLMTPFHKKKSRSKGLVVKLTCNGKGKEVILMQIVAKAFLGPIPPGHVAYHKNGCQSDNYVSNIAYISKQELGKKTGARSRKQSVAKINSDGEIVAFYPSAREAAGQNFMSRQTITDRCNGNCKSAFAPDGYAYAWEDSEISMKHALAKIERERNKHGKGK